MDGPFREKVLRIVLVRHGETDWNKNKKFQGQRNIGLNEKGRAQAEALASALKEEPLKVIYSSPIARAVETAEIINRYHNVSLEQRDGLKEMNVGDFEGLQLKDLAGDYSQFFREWLEDAASVRMPNGETLQEVQERAWSVLEEVVDDYSEGSVLLCAHNFVNQMVLCKILGVKIAHFRRIRQTLAAMNIIERIQGVYSLTCTNDTCHLKGIDLNP